MLEEYLRFIRRSQAQLDTVSFTSQRPIDNILSSLLQGMPGLEKLYIGGATSSSDTLNVLKSPDICPRLFSVVNQGPLIDGESCEIDLRMSVIFQETAVDWQNTSMK